MESMFCLCLFTVTLQQLIVLNCIRLTFPFDPANGNAKGRTLKSRQLKVSIYLTQAHSALESTLLSCDNGKTRGKWQLSVKSLV